MKKLALGAMLILGAAIASPAPGHAAGDGLDRNAGAQGNGRTGGMIRGATQDSRAAMRSGRKMRMRRR